MIGWMIKKDGSTYRVIDDFIGKYEIFDDIDDYGGLCSRYFVGVAAIELDGQLIRFAEELSRDEWVGVALGEKYSN